jgi:hypothetical protein
MGKKNLVIGLMILILALFGIWLHAFRNLPAQPDIVTLKNNSIVRGEIVEQEFGKYVVILNETNRKQVITWDQIHGIELSFVPWYFRVHEALDWVVRIGVVGGFVIFGVGLWQYSQSQKWKRAEFLLSEIRLFEPKQNIVNVRRILDNTQADVYLYGEKDAEGKQEKPVSVDRSMLLNALTESSDLKRDHDDDERAIRVALNSYLSHLDHFNNVIDSGLVRKQELKLYLQHYLDIVGNQRNEKLSNEIRNKLWVYMYSNGYEGALNLLKKFGYQPST